MKNAYQYVRISQLEQSNWSISGQQDINKTYAERHGINIIKTYSDEGRSAKDFDRPAWKQLCTDLSKNRRDVDYLIISKYDRLIRNALQGLQQIEKIENKWGVQVLSAMESYAINPEDPMFFKMRADFLVNAEFERRIISDRSKFGTWQAKLQGRHIGQAPWGYKNARDDRNRPTIIMDRDKKHVIQEIFDRYLNGDPLQVISEAAKSKGFTVKGRSAISRTLSNPVYAGIIRVPPYKGEPEKMVDAIHEPMVEKYTYYRVIEKMRATDTHAKVSLDGSIPLRGLIVCDNCSNALTGAKSKGRGGYYYYYKCNKCKGQNHSAIKAHDQLDTILSLLSFDKEIIDRIQDKIEEIYFAKAKSAGRKVSQLKGEIRVLSNRLDGLEDKYIRDAITQETYDKWSSRIRRDLSGKEYELSNLELLDESIIFDSRIKLERMNGLQDIYHKMDVIGKQDLFKGLFPVVSSKTKEGYRTRYINPLFAHNLPKFSNLDVLEITDMDYQFTSNPVSTPNGTIIEHINSFHRLLNVV